MKCNNCGFNNKTGANFCSNCGSPLNNYQFNNGQTYDNPDDSGSFWWGVLGYCFQLLGVILFILWRNDRPKTAKKLLIGAIISFFTPFAMLLFYGILGLLSS